MIAAKSLQDAVYGAIFPGGMIPLRCKDLIPAIDARIKEIAELAEGKIIEGMNRRLAKSESLALTEQIIQLRDSCEPPMSYREIMRRLGNCISPDAARNRYDDAKKAREDAAMQQEGHAAISGEAIRAGRYTTPPEVQGKINSSDHVGEPNKLIPATEDGNRKENETDIAATAPPALQEAQSQQSEEATIREGKIVQEIQEDKRDLTAKQAGHINGPKIPHSEDDYIMQLRVEGKLFREIHDAIQAKGIVCTLDDVTARYQSEKKKRAQAAPIQPEPPTDPSQPGAEGAQEPARANPRGTPEAKQSAPTTPKPDPKSISRAELDEKIWKAWKAGKTPDEISNDLCAEGLYYGKKSVELRLRQQGADL